MSNRIIVEPEQELEEEKETELENLEKELETSQEDKSKDDDSNEEGIPDKFRGKSLKEVIESYTNLEKAYSRQGQEMGHLRKSADELIKQSLEFRMAKEAPKEEEKEITAEEIWTNPQAAIDRAIKKSLSESSLGKEVESIKERNKALEIKSSYKNFLDKHPDAGDLTNSEEFLDWASATPVRAALLKRAQSLDFSAGDELVSLYKEIKGLSKKQEAKDRADKARKDTLNKAAVETNSTGDAPKKIFKRRDILRMIRENPEEYYSDDFQTELQKAYREGRVK